MFNDQNQPAAAVAPIRIPDYRSEWRSQETHTSVEMAYYVLSRALNYSQNERREGDENPVQWAARRLKKSFPPIIKPSKLANGRKPYDTLQKIIYSISRESEQSKTRGDVTFQEQCQFLAGQVHMELRRG
jgi:hypothetical protein